MFMLTKKYIDVSNRLFNQYNGNEVLFNSHYTAASKQIEDNLPNGHDAIVDSLVAIMQSKLDAYAKTQAKSKGGRIARFFAPILSAILPIFKSIKFKK
jgi:hypothetical protein